MKLPKCPCGGRFHEEIVDELDLSEQMGVSCVAKKVPIQRCDRCGDEALGGNMVNWAVRNIAVQMMLLPVTLDGMAARFLRKMLPASQKDLAKRLGIARETIVRWEAGKAPLSPQQDLMLRMMAFASLSGLSQPDGGPSWLQVRNAQLDGALASLTAVKPARPVKAPPTRYVIERQAA